MSVSRAAMAAPLSPPRPEPRSIRFETQNFLVRTLELADVTERACAWFADPDKAKMINAIPRAMSAAEFTDYITSHDRVTGHAIGIFDRSTGLHLGLWAIYVDWDRREFLVNVLVGERGYEPGPRHETQRRLMEIFFEEFDLEAVRFAILAKNERLQGRINDVGINSDHTSYKPSVANPAFEEINHYSITREVWRGFRGTREQRDMIKDALDAAWPGI